MHGDTHALRDDEPFEHAALATYLRWHLADEQLPGLRLDEEMQVSQFSGGHSNRTYLIRCGGAELVLRRPPVGPLHPRAHDVAREYRWLKALHPLFPLAPRPYLLCEDGSVLGGVFYVMERRRGIVARGEEPIPLAGHPDLRARASRTLVDTLAALHAVEISKPPLSDLGRPIGFLDRQVRGWTDRWQRARTASLPAMETVALWLAAHQPPDALDPTVVHGDFRLDNVLLEPLDPSHVTAVLDWEMAALGDPLVDLGIMLAYWTLPESGPDEVLPTVTGRPGYLTHDDIVERYAQRSGRDVSSLPYYEVFGLFRIAVVLQQMDARHMAAPTVDPRAATLGDRVRALAARAVSLTSSL